MKRAFVILAFGLTVAVAYGQQIQSTTIDLRRSNRDFSFSAAEETTPIYRAYIQEDGSAYTDVDDLVGILFFSSNETAAVGMAITNTASAVNYLEWTLTQDQTAEPGEYFAQIVVTNISGSVQEWARGALTLNESPGTTYISGWAWNATNYADLAWVEAQIAAIQAGLTNLTARRVTYDNATYTNVQDALDALLYIVPSVSLSGGGTYDQGRVVTNLTLTWTCSKTMTSRELSGGATVSLGAGGSGAYTVTNALDSSQTTYTLTVGDGTGTANNSTVNYFRDRRYWGFSSTATALSSAQIIALSDEFATTEVCSEKTGLTPTGNQYLWYCYPASWGAAAQIVLGGYPTTFDRETASFTNAYGHAASFYRYRSPNLIGYTTSMEVQ